jgi:hypothetical protein
LTEISSDFANLYKKCPTHSFSPAYFSGFATLIGRGRGHHPALVGGEHTGEEEGRDEQGEVNERKR